jgi:antitoxin VapB
MIQMSRQTEALARKLAAFQGISAEDAVERAVERSARDAGVAIDSERREPSNAAVAARKARMRRIAAEIASMPLLDPRSVEDIVDDLNAL